MLNFVLLILREMQGVVSLENFNYIALNDLEFFHFLSFTVMNPSGSKSSSDTEEDFEDLIFMAMVYEMHHVSTVRQPCRTSALTGYEYVQELIHGHPDRMFDSFRMELHVFVRLCETMKSAGFLDDSREVCVEEAMGIFILTVCHNTRNRMVAERFQHSGETISKHFNRVLKALCRYSHHIITPRYLAETPPEVLHNPRYYPWFEVNQLCPSAIKTLGYGCNANTLL